MLGVCVGFQLLFEDSEESPGIAGLGVFEGTVARLRGTEKLPQMQWNVLERVPGGSRCSSPGSRSVRGSTSSTPTRPSPRGVGAGAVVATCDYGGPVVAMVERGTCFGTQFHPEKSGSSGLAVLAAFATCCGAIPFVRT